MTPEIWLRLAKRVNELLAMPEIAGVLLLLTITKTRDPQALQNFFDN